MVQRLLVSGRAAPGRIGGCGGSGRWQDRAAEGCDCATEGCYAIAKSAPRDGGRKGSKAAERGDSLLKTANDARGVPSLSRRRGCVEGVFGRQLRRASG